jgi:hypothetical protein
MPVKDHGLSDMQANFRLACIRPVGRRIIQSGSATIPEIFNHTFVLSATFNETSVGYG